MEFKSLKTGSLFGGNGNGQFTRATEGRMRKIVTDGSLKGISSGKHRKIRQPHVRGHAHTHTNTHIRGQGESSRPSLSETRDKRPLGMDPESPPHYKYDKAFLLIT